MGFSGQKSGTSPASLRWKLSAPAAGTDYELWAYADDMPGGTWPGAQCSTMSRELATVAAYLSL